MTFEIFLKSFLPWIMAIITFVYVFSKLQSKVKEHEKLLTSGENGKPPFLTIPDHKDKQESCQNQIELKIENINNAMGEMKATMKEGDECRKDARRESSEQFSALRKEAKSFYDKMENLMIPLLEKTAVHESEIKHLQEKSR